MSATDSNSTQRLKNAEERLARAIGRLQAAVEEQGRAAPQPADSALANELSRLQTENAQLRALVGQASERLDATIGKLKSRMGA